LDDALAAKLGDNRSKREIERLVTASDFLSLFTCPWSA